MPNVIIRVARHGNGWSLQVDGVVDKTFMSKGGAIEFATMTAGIAVRQGFDVTIKIDGESGKIRYRGVSGVVSG